MTPFRYWEYRSETIKAEDFEVTGLDWGTHRWEIFAVRETVREQTNPELITIYGKRERYPPK